ncbi:uncharacterized protein LOC133386473 [Rhineura floridana]|uniref:uncharacterized protein LOC133386473 n=1 Tax=Rhineura floridana TaxID=261503 RepID=UPI002AC8707A|nr:uncharacterized protein LOC133386473 [Rhineura floridana]
MAEQPEMPQTAKLQPSKTTKTKHVKAAAKTKHLPSHSKPKRPRYASAPTHTRAVQEQLSDVFHSPAASSDEEEFAGFPAQPTTSQPPPMLPPRAYPMSQSTAPTTQGPPSAAPGLQLSHEFLSQLQGMLSFLQTQSPQVPAIPQHSTNQYVYNEANSSCSPNPYNTARGRGIDDFSCGAESPFVEQDEGDEWSDYSEHEEDTSYRLFNASDYQPLVRRVVSTLGLQAIPPATTTPAIKGARVLKSPAPVEHYLPVPDPIAKLAADEWAHPLQARRFKNLVDKLYSLAPDFTNKLAVPGIDEPITSLVSRSLLPREGESQLKYATERRLDFALRKNHEATAFSMRASASASIFSRAAMMWLDDLLEDPNPDPASMRRSLIKLCETAAFPFRGTRPGGRDRDFRSYNTRPFRGAWNRRFQGRGLRLACQLRQKPSSPNPMPTTSRGDVGHPAGNGVPVSRSHHCHHKHRKVLDATNIHRCHASSQGTRNVHLYHPYCAMGSSPHSSPSVGFVAFSTGHCQLQSSQSSLEPRTAPFIPLVDEGPTSFQGHSVQRTPQNCCHHRCQSHRLGSPLQLPVCSGGLVHRRADSEHQLAGAKGCPLSSTSFSVSVPFGPCYHSNGQHVCKITFEHTGGHQVPPSAGPSLPHLRLGRTTSTIPESRTSQRDLECDSRLAQQTTGFSGRMEASSNRFPSSSVSVRHLLNRPVCFQSQLPASQVLCLIPGHNSGSSGCSVNTMARRSFVRLPSNTTVSQNLEEGAEREGTAGSDSTILATPTVVLGSSYNVSDGSLATTSQARPSIPGSNMASGPHLAQSNSVAFERGHLRLAGLSDAVIDIILASRRPSTTRIYQHTWVAFSKWCQSHHHDPSQATMQQVLQYLHSGFMMGLRPNTLRRHASTLSSILSVSSSGATIASHLFIKRFLRGVALRSPAVVHRFPSWSLSKVLQALQCPPFEPIRTVPLRLLSFKVLFLIAVTSARRVSELGALSSARHLCVFHKDSVVLKTEPSVPRSIQFSTATRTLFFLHFVRILPILSRRLGIRWMFGGLSRPTCLGPRIYDELSLYFFQCQLA